LPPIACGCDGDVVADANGLGDAAAGVGDSGRGAEGEADAVADGDARAAAVEEALVALDGGLELASPVAGRTPTGAVNSAAGTAIASATRPATATIGTSATRPPRGKRSRQLGQKPETGVAT
jgi:hypothetical protein